MKRREAREREQIEARERADRHREELIARLRSAPGDQPPGSEVSVQPQEDAVSDKTPKRPPKKKKPKA